MGEIREAEAPPPISEPARVIAGRYEKLWEISSFHIPLKPYRKVVNPHGAQCTTAERTTNIAGSALGAVSTHGLAASPSIAVLRIDLVFLDSPGIPTNALPAAERAPAPDVLRCTAQGHLRGCGQYQPWATIPAVLSTTMGQLQSSLELPKQPRLHSDFPFAFLASLSRL